MKVRVGELEDAPRREDRFLVDDVLYGVSADAALDELGEFYVFGGYRLA